MEAMVRFLNTAGKPFVEFALAMLFQSSILIALLLGLDLLLQRKVRAVLRYWIWMLVVVKLALPTTLSLPTSPAYWLGEKPPTVRVDDLVSAKRPADLFESHMSDTGKTPTEAAASGSPPTLANAEVSVAPAIESPKQGASSDSAVVLTWQGLAFLVWLVVVLGMLLLVVQRMFFIRSIFSQSKAAQGRMADVFRRCCEQIRIRRPVSLRLSAVIGSPSVCGLLRPTVLVPEAPAAKLDKEQLRSVLLHELAHLKRGDLWVGLAQTLLQVIYFYNPLLWVANAAIRKVREQAVDEMVLVAMGEEAENYPRTLLSVSKLAFARPTFSLRLIGIVESKKALTARIGRIVDRPYPKRAKLGLGGLLGVIIAAVILLPMARAQKQESRDTIADAVKPPFVFQIHAMTPEGRPQPGVKVRCLHPRAERGAEIVDTVETSNEAGMAEFHVTDADLVTDRYFWFSLSDDKFIGTCGVGISPIDNVYAYTFRVLPAQEFKLQVIDEHGKPIQGAKLWLVADHPDFPRSESDVFTASTTAHSNSEGLATVRFAPVKANIAASVHGYASTFVRTASLSKDRPYEVRLSAGYKITGTVVDEKGNPIEEVRITAKRKNFILDYLDDFILKDKTNTKGRFELANASAGEYEIHAHVQDPNSPLHVQPATINVGKNVPIANVELRAESGAILKGRYVTKHNLRTSNRRVLVHTYSPVRTHWEVETKKDGTFIVPGLPPKSEGSIDFIGVSGFHETIRMTKPYPFFKVEGRGMRFRDVPPGVYSGIEVEFLLAGRANGIVTDVAGKPLADLELVVQPDGRIYRTNNKGMYSAEIPPNEDVTLEVRAPLLRQTLLKSEPFRLQEGKVIEKNLTVRGELARLVDYKAGFELSGQVLTKEGSPIEGATVFLGNTFLTPGSVSSSCRDKKACPVPPTWEGGAFRPAYLKSGAKGSFSFNLLLPGKTDVWAEHPDFGLGWVREVNTDQKDVKIVIRPQPKTLTCSGTVLDPEAQPVPGVAIHIYGEQQGEKALIAQSESNAEGRFMVEVTPSWTHFRQLTLVCIPRKGPLAWRTMPYCSGSDMQLRLKREAAVSGKVANRNGNGIVEAAVRLYQVAHPDYGTLFATDEIVQCTPATHTDESGVFALGKVPGGSSVSLYADHPEYGSKYAWHIWVPDEGTRTEDIELPDGITVEGFVRYAGTNRPAEGVRVEAQPRYGLPQGQAVTDSAGHYRIAGLEENRPDAMYIISGKGRGDPPEWEGQTVVDKKLEPGDSLTGVNILVQRTLAARQKEWLTSKAKGLKGNSWVAVLDDCDPAYNGKSVYEDTVTVYDGTGISRGQYNSLNTCQTVGANHAIAYNRSDESLWCAELVGDRLVKLKTDGTLMWEKKDLKPHALAVDPKTGNVWVLTTEGTIYGKSVLVLSPSGEKISDWDIGAFDIGYSEHDDCFWLVGKNVLKVDRKGKIIYDRPDKFAWLAVSVSINNSDGSVWIVERRHGQVSGSQNCLLILEPDGRTRKEIILDRGYPMCVAVDSSRGFVWLATSEGVLKLGLDGRMIADVPLRGFSVCVQPDTGYVWVAGHGGLYQLDLNGNLVWSKDSPGGSQKWVCVILR